MLAALSLATACAASGAFRCGCLCTSSALAEPAFDALQSLSVDTAYDSNVFNGRGPDMVVKVAPHFDLRLRDGRGEILVGYDLGLWIYALSKAENSVNHRGRISLEERLSRRLTLDLADELIYAKDPGYLWRAGVVAPQTSILDNTLDAALAFRFTRRLDGTLRYEFRRTTFGEPPAGSPPLFDGDQHDAAAALDYRVGRSDDLRIVHRFSYFNADGVDLAVSNAPALGWRHQFARPVDLRVEGGPVFYTLFAASRAVVPDAPGSGVTWRAAATLRVIGPHLRGTLTGYRDLVGGTGAGTVLWADYAEARVAYHKARLVDAGLGVGVFANGYAPDARRGFDGVTVDGGVDFDLGDGLHAGAYYAFRWQEELLHDPAAARLPSITRHVVGVRLAFVIGEGAHPRRELQP